MLNLTPHAIVAMDYWWFGLLILGLGTLFGTLASAFVFAVLNWCGVDVDE